ncbi:MAG: hypothetical protein ACOX1P_05235 [Thermoguttaceae bacterium]|jgi:hypothetical protein
MTAPRSRPRKAPASPPASPAATNPRVIDADSVYPFAEVCRRLGWARHSARQARRLALPVVRFGVRDYVIGSDVITWFQRLGEQQRQQRGGENDDLEA